MTAHIPMCRKPKRKPMISMRPSAPPRSHCRRPLIDWDVDNWGGHVAVSSSGVSTPHGAVYRSATAEPGTQSPPGSR